MRWTARAALVALACWLWSMAVAGDVMSAPATVRLVAEAMELTAVFHRGQVRLLLPDGRDVTLPQVASRKGRVTRYAAGDISLTLYRGIARLEMDGITYLLQEWDPSLDPWERARRAGVNFRAIGQEPGWMAEIRDGQRIELLLDYGETRITMPISLPEAGADGRTVTYRTPADHLPIQLKVIITVGTCYDGMSGEKFPASVAVHLAGSSREYHGCGRWLP